MAVGDYTVPVYVINGFLESGKTTFLNGTIHQSYFRIPETSLLILCEEGEMEYDAAELKKRQRTEVEIIEKPEDLTTEKLEELAKKHRPERVLIEFNPLWSTDKLRQMQLPEDWELVQQIVVADASTFQVYMNNMKSLFVEMVRDADMVIFNRSTKDLPLPSFRRSVKVVNPSAEITFENPDHEVEDIFEDSLPYDMDGDCIEVAEEDYGIWYVDMMDNPDDYDGKKVHFAGRVMKSRDLPDENCFVPGRMAMTCCADDTTFLGYVCRYEGAKDLENGQWVEVTATIGHRFLKVYNRKGPVLTAESVKPCAPLKDEMVYFN